MRQPKDLGHLRMFRRDKGSLLLFSDEHLTVKGFHGKPTTLFQMLNHFSLWCICVYSLKFVIWLMLYISLSPLDIFAFLKWILTTEGCAEFPAPRALSSPKMCLSGRVKRPCSFLLRPPIPPPTFTHLSLVHPQLTIQRERQFGTVLTAGQTFDLNSFMLTKREAHNFWLE